MEYFGGLCKIPLVPLEYTHSTPDRKITLNLSFAELFRVFPHTENYRELFKMGSDRYFTVFYEFDLISHASPRSIFARSIPKLGKARPELKFKIIFTVVQAYTSPAILFEKKHTLFYKNFEWLFTYCDRIGYFRIIYSIKDTI